jgi:hypothetical protein
MAKDAGGLTQNLAQLSNSVPANWDRSAWSGVVLQANAMGAVAGDTDPYPKGTVTGPGIGW